ncbi:MAG: hypothetical protein MUC85_11070 [Anaerolineales bacterium]|nr:hypothetical protein [Anaerolineales bacterium]
MDSDPSIRWQVLRDLLDAPADLIAQERQKLAVDGWGAALLACQEASGLWGGQLYNHKWLSTTYTLLLLRQMGLQPGNLQAQRACQALLEGGYQANGGISFAKTVDTIDHGVAGMILSLLAYFGYPDERVHKLQDFLLAQQLPDGRWEPEPGNAQLKYTLAATLQVLEGLYLYQERYPERSNQAAAAQEKGREFLLAYHLFQDVQAGRVIDPKLTLFSFPPRWYYDVLAALDHFQACRAERDARLEDAIALLKARQTRDGTWKLQNRHAGKTFFEMETVGQPSRWNTLRALRVLRWWEGA